MKKTMPQIWIMEKAGRLDAGQPSLVVSLLGNHAVRAMGSLEALKNALRTSTAEKCALLVVREEDFHTHWDELAEFHERAIPSMPVLLIALTEGVGLACGHALRPGFIRLDLSKDKPDAFGISSVVLRFLSEGVRQAPETGCSYKDLKVNRHSSQLRIEGHPDPIDLSLKEYSILTLFLEHAGRCLSREKIKDHIWPGFKVSIRTIDSHVSNLRKKLQPSSADIRSIYGGGYLFE